MRGSTFTLWIIQSAGSAQLGPEVHVHAFHDAKLD